MQGHDGSSELCRALGGRPGDGAFPSLPSFLNNWLTDGRGDDCLPEQDAASGTSRCVDEAGASPSSRQVPLNRSLIGHKLNPAWRKTQVYTKTAVRKRPPRTVELHLGLLPTNEKIAGVLAELPQQNPSRTYNMEERRNIQKGSTVNKQKPIHTFRRVRMWR